MYTAVSSVSVCNCALSLLNSNNFVSYNVAAFRQYKCNGHRECSDGSDEEDCTIDCQYDEFQCAEHECILLKNVCGKGRPQFSLFILITNRSYHF